MYPFLKEGVSIGTFRDKNSDRIRYYIENADGEKFEVDHKLWKSVINLDGTHPLNLPIKDRWILSELKKHGLVQTSRFVHENGIINRFILFPISNRNKNIKLVCKLLNAILPLISVLIFTISLYFMKSNTVTTDYYFSWLLYYGLLICSLVFHEVGHLIAGLAYGYKVSDTGILLFGILPIGAYVAYEDKKDASKVKKMQFALAGIEANLLIAGICMLIAVQCPSLYMLMSSIANINMVLVLVNLLPTSNLDGESALSALFEINNISKVAEKWLFTKKLRQKLFSSGFPGYIFFCVLVVTMLSKLLFMLIIGFDIISMLLVFLGFPDKIIS